MTDERLKDIQDNINERNMFPSRMYIFREDINDEEQELVNEIERLNNIINELEKWLDIQITCSSTQDYGVYKMCLNKIKELEKSGSDE